MTDDPDPLVGWINLKKFVSLANSPPWEASDKPKPHDLLAGLPRLEFADQNGEPFQCYHVGDVNVLVTDLRRKLAEAEAEIARLRVRLHDLQTGIKWLTAERDEALRRLAAAREYTQHKPDCEDRDMGAGKNCSCGLRQALAPPAPAAPPPASDPLAGLERYNDDGSWARYTVDEVELYYKSLRQQLAEANERAAEAEDRIRELLERRMETVTMCELLMSEKTQAETEIERLTAELREAEQRERQLRQVQHAEIERLQDQLTAAEHGELVAQLDCMAIQQRADAAEARLAAAEAVCDAAVKYWYRPNNEAGHKLTLAIDGWQAASGGEE